MPKTGLFPKGTSTYTPHAGEIAKTVLFRQGVYSSADTRSWVDVGLQILLKNGRAPECAAPNNLDIERTLPHTRKPKLLRPGLFLAEIESLAGIRGVTDPKKRKIEVFAGVAQIDNVGATACLVLYENRIVHKNLCVHGQIMG